MPQFIQRPPIGLLGLIDSKAGGQNPNALQDEVRPVIDITAMYAVQQRLSRNAAIAAPVLGLNVAPVNLAEPAAGEIWLMRAISCRTTAVIAVAPTFRFVVGVHDVRNTSFTCLSPFVAQAAAAGEHLITGAVLDYIWRPGDQAAVFVLNATNAAALSIALTFDRIAT